MNDEIKEVVLEKMRFSINQQISTMELQNVSVDGYINYITQSLVVQLTTQVAGHRFEDALYPADWKEAFKERWFPEWLLERSPVVNRPLSVLALYPKLPLPPEGDMVPVFHVTKGPLVRGGRV